MVKQKIVVSISSNPPKQALQIAAGMHGITSVKSEGENIVVEGDGVDAIKLITDKRKKMGFMTWVFKKNMGSARIVSVEVIEEKKEAKEEKKKEEDKIISYAQAMNWPPPFYVYQY